MVVLQDRMPEGQEALASAPMPRMVTVPETEWFRVDGAYGAQLAEKTRLVAELPEAVMAALPGTEDLLEKVLAEILGALALRPDFVVAGDRVRRPDGVEVDLGAPLPTLSRLIQEDVCVLEKRGEEHVLVAALLCFPAAWTLAEKIGRPMTGIHRPVRAYEAGIASRIQRMFDRLPEGVCLRRANWLRYESAELFSPYPEGAARPEAGGDAPFLRSESQTVRRVPAREAVIFTIHTTLVRA